MEVIGLPFLLPTTSEFSMNDFGWFIRIFGSRNGFFTLDWSLPVLMLLLLYLAARLRIKSE